MVLLNHLNIDEMLGENVDENYTRMLCAVFNKYWKQHPTKQSLLIHLTRNPRKNNKPK